MSHELSESSQKIMTLAQNEARQMNHGYVGTEHILLALLIERPGALEALGVTADAIRKEIQTLVTPGPCLAASLAKLPLTPRSQSVIDYARLETINHGQKLIEPEHLLLGLIHEPDGVAGRVMRNLGLDLRQVHEETLKLRLAQMKIVERAVRPVRAGMAGKRKMREELLAHLSEIYEEEYLRLGDPGAALREAEKRFGDLAELSRELQGTQKWHDRQNYWFERWFGWRPPESAIRWMLRVSFLFCCCLVCFISIPLIIEMIACGGQFRQYSIALRALAAMSLITPLLQFLLGVCYYKIRDSVFGVFGSRKSLGKGILLAAVASLCILICSASTIVLMDGFQAVPEFTVPLFAVSVFGGIVTLILAQVHGPVQIRDTVWACMDLKTAE